MSADLLTTLPELVLAAGGLLLLVLPGFSSEPDRRRVVRVLGLMTIFFLAGGLKLALLQLAGGPFLNTVFSGLMVQDRFASFFQIAVLAAMVLVVLGVMGYGRGELRTRRELYALLLLITAALMILAGAANLVLLYLSIETMSIFSYLLTGMLRKDSLSAEGGLKYFLFGSLATGTMLYGISLIYGLTGTFDLNTLAVAFPRAMIEAPILSMIALFLLIVGFGFKTSLVPFHMWAPDAYEGAPTPVTAFLAGASKLAAFGALARFLLVGLTPAVGLWPILLGVLAVLTMTVGNLVALVQTNVKRLLAYSSIAHAGTMVIGLAVASPLGLTATLYYLIAYLLMNTGAFLGVIAVGEATGREDISAFSGLSRREPALAFMMTVVLLSLAGIPPLGGFFAKMWIFGAALQKGAVGLAVVAAINSVVSVFYYLKIVKAMYLDPAPAGAVQAAGFGTVRLAMVLCTLGIFLIGLWPGRLLLVAADVLPIPVKTGDLPWLPVH